MQRVSRYRHLYARVSAGDATGNGGSVQIARKCLPGPYTFILPASKSLPKICLLDTSSAGHTRLSKCQQRKTIGCRLPDCEVTLALLDLLDAPLMCSTVPFDGDVQPIVMRDEYSRCAFVLDAARTLNNSLRRLSICLSERAEGFKSRCRGCIRMVRRRRRSR